MNTFRVLFFVGLLSNLLNVFGATYCWASKRQSGRVKYQAKRNKAKRCHQDCDIDDVKKIDPLRQKICDYVRRRIHGFITSEINLGRLEVIINELCPSLTEVHWEKVGLCYKNFLKEIVKCPPENQFFFSVNLLTEMIYALHKENMSNVAARVEAVGEEESLGRIKVDNKN